MGTTEFEILSDEGGTCLREPGASMEVGYCEVEASADFKAMQMKCSNRISEAREEWYPDSQEEVDVLYTMKLDGVGL